MKLLSVADLKLMSSLVTSQGNLGVVQTVHYCDAVLGRYLFAGIVELFALIAPIKVGVTNDFGRSSGIFDTFRDD